MGIFDKLSQQFSDLKEQGLDLAPISTNVIVRANDTVVFPSEYDGDAITAALRVEDISLTEVSLGRQEKSGVGQSGDFLLVLETTLALPGAQLGIWEDEQFKALPIYGDNDFEVITRQTPLVFGQLLRANFKVGEDGKPVEGDELAAFKALLDEAGYIPRSPRASNSAFNPTRERLWSVEAPNRQTGNYANDLTERTQNGLMVEDFTIVPPQPAPGVDMSTTAARFNDMFSAWMTNFERVVESTLSEDPKVLRNGRKLMSSLTGATDDGENVYAGRATIPALTVARGHEEGQGRHRHWVAEPAMSFSFWSSAIVANESAPAL